VKPRKNTRRNSTKGDTDFRASRLKVGPDEYLVLSFSHADMRRLSGLSPTEQEIVHHLVAGCSNAEIAQLRRTSVRTVANQVASVYRKLRVRGRSELSSLVMSTTTPTAVDS
jgi:DNA-binding CsgD family transcriptional regulator